MSRLELAKKLFKGRGGRSKLTAIEDAHKRKESAKKAQAKAGALQGGISRASSQCNGISEDSRNSRSSFGISSSSSSSSSRSGNNSSSSTSRSVSAGRNLTAGSNDNAGRKRSRPTTIVSEMSPWSDLYELINQASEVPRPLKSAAVSAGSSISNGQNIWQPSPGVMNALKQRVRSGGDDAGRAAAGYCCQQLKANSAEVRLGTLEVLNWLFLRSRVVRTIVVGRLSEVISLVTGSAFSSTVVDGGGFDRLVEAEGAGETLAHAQRAPGPPEVAVALRVRGAEYVRGWALDRRFSDLYPELRVALRYLEEAHRVPAPNSANTTAAAAATRSANGQIAGPAAGLSLHRIASPPPLASTVVGMTRRSNGPGREGATNHAHVGSTARSARARFCRTLREMGLLQRREEGEASSTSSSSGDSNTGSQSSARGLGSSSSSSASSATLTELEASVTELEEAVRLLAPSAEDELEWRGAQGNEGSHVFEQDRSNGDDDSDNEVGRESEVASEPEGGDAGNEGIDGEWGSDGEWEDGDPNAAAAAAAAAAVVTQQEYVERASESVYQSYWSSEEEDDEDGVSGNGEGEGSNDCCSKRSKNSSSSALAHSGSKNVKQMPTLAQTVATAGLGTAAAYEVEFEVSLDGGPNDSNNDEANNKEDDESGASATRAVLRETRRALLKRQAQGKLKAWRLELTLARAAGLLHGDDDADGARRGNLAESRFAKSGYLVPSYVSRGLEARLERLQNRLEGALWKCSALAGESE